MKRLKGIIKKIWPYGLTAFIITAPWWFKSGYLFFVDMVWGPNVVFDVFSRSMYFDLIVWLLSVALPVSFVEKLFIFAVFFLLTIAGAKIAGHFSQDRRIHFLTGLFAVFNPFVYDRALYGQFGLLAGLGFFFLAFAYLLEYSERKSLRQLILSGIFAGLSLNFSLHFSYFLLVIYILFFAVLLLKKFNLKTLVTGFLAMGTIVALVNAHWIIGSVVVKEAEAPVVPQDIATEDLFAFKTSGENSWEVVSNVLLMSGFWGKDQHRYVDLTTMDSWGKSFLILLPFILAGLIVGIRKKASRALSIGLVAVFAVSAVLAIGVSTPFSKGITQWLFDNAPFYKGLRETQKWASMIVLVYAIFLAMGLTKFFEIRLIKKNKHVTLVFMALIIILQAPLLLWGFRDQIVPHRYPEGWYEAERYIVEHNKDCEKNSIFLPWHKYMSFYFVGGVAASPAQDFFSCFVHVSSNPEFAGLAKRGGPDDRLVESWIMEKGERPVPEPLNARYVILVKEFDWENYKWVEEAAGLRKIFEKDSLILYETVN